jgi:hypothetical protein
LVSQISLILVLEPDEKDLDSNRFDIYMHIVFYLDNLQPVLSQR